MFDHPAVQDTEKFTDLRFLNKPPGFYLCPTVFVMEACWTKFKTMSVFVPNSVINSVLNIISVAAKMSFLCRLAGLSFREAKKLCHPGGARSRAAAPPHREESEVAGASSWNASWTPPWQGVQGTSHR